MGKSGIQKALKVTAWILGVFLALDMLIVGLLFVPSIQTFVVQKVTDGLKQSLGLDLTIGNVRITPTLKLVVHEVTIKDLHDENMIYAGTVKGRLRGLSIKPFKLRLSDVSIDKPDVVVRFYQGDSAVNISVWAKQFKTDKKEKSPFLLSSNSVEITNGRFAYINDSIRTVFDTSDHPDIDYAFLELTDLNLSGRDFQIIDDDVSMQLKKLAIRQYGGFELLDGSGDFRICKTNLTLHNLKLRTPRSDLDLDLRFLYDNWTSYGEFIDSIRIAANIRPSTLSMVDIVSFAPKIRGMDEVFHLQADSVDGTIADFRVRNMKANWLDHNLVQGDFAFRNISDFLNATFDVTLDSTVFHLPDLAQFSLPKGKTIPSSKILNKVGTTTVSGTFRGELDDFKAKLTAATGLGTVKADVSTDSHEGKMHLNGNVASDNFNLAKLIDDHRSFGTCHLDANVEGHTASTGFTAENLKSLQAHLDANIRRFPLFGYPLQSIHVEGDYQEGLYNATLRADDPNLQCDVIAQLDNTQSVPFLQGSVDLQDFAGGNIGKMLPLVDTANATGVFKIISILQHNPNLHLSFDHFQIAMHGHNLDDCNGFLGCDNIQLTFNEENFSNERLRLTTFNKEGWHKYILASNIASATFESTYTLASIKDTLQNIAHNFFPTLISAVEKQKSSVNESDNSLSNGYLKLNVSTYDTRNITKLFYPNLLIAPNSTVDLDIRDNHIDDRVEVDLPFFGIRQKVRLHHFHLTGHTTDPTKLDLSVRGDSVIVHAGKASILFDRVNVRGDVANDIVRYNLSWHNSFNAEQNVSELSGDINIGQADNIVFHLDTSKIYLKDYECHFNDQNVIRIQPNHYTVDNLLFYTQGSSISVNGDYDTRDSSRLKMAAKNVNISLINPLLSGISFGGELSADLNLMHRNGNRLIFGKIITDELNMNGSRLGDLFLVAGLNNENAVRFSGGLFNSSEKRLDYEYLRSFSIRDFREEKRIVANITGNYENKKFMTEAVFDTLQIDFLQPFLSSFSDILTGNASGNISFIASPDSTYLSGKAHVIDANMGISMLGTRYRILNQDIFFDPEGIYFRDVQVLDKDNNTASLTGSVKHKMFKNIRLDLNLNTDRLLAINTPHTTTALFYGTGYVKGDVSITGTESLISIKGPNIQTLNGTKFYLQVTSASSASETGYIHFVPRYDTVKKEQETESKKGADIRLDFTFNVTNESEVILQLDAIGGTVDARADGQFQLIYDTRDNVYLYGGLLMHSGDIKISLLDVVNSKFTLVPGGTINFDGPIESITVNMSAYKTSKTSLSNIVPAEYLPSGNTDVNSYIYLNGPLMLHIEPTFGFELPNSSNEVRNLFYTAIDTQNKENMTKQFAYFLVTNTFMPENMFASDASTGISGMSLLSNVINNLIGNVIDSKRGGFGFTYNEATEKTSAEYGVKANANLMNDRILMTTSFGYYDNRAVTNAYQNIYGNLSVEYLINPAGTWRVKAYTRIGERDDYYYLDDNFNNYVAGVALMYNQDFDSPRRNRQKHVKKSKKQPTSSKNEQ